MLDNLTALFSDVPHWVWLALAGFYGAIIGSFLNVCIYRIPRKEEVVKQPSHCPHCGENIPWYLNIPIISWFILLGKTACCGKSLQFRYALVEILSATLTIYQFHVFGFSLKFLAGWIFTSLLLILIFIDWEHMRLPNILTIPGTVIGILFAIFSDVIELDDALFGLAVGAGGLLAIYLLYKYARGIEGLGLGDVKLMAMIGVFLGWRYTLIVVVIGSALALVYGVFVMVQQKTGGKTAIPFGVFLGAAAIIIWLWGTGILNWYMGFFISSKSLM